MSRPSSSTRITQTPGGNQTFNLFSPSNSSNSSNDSNNNSASSISDNVSAALNYRGKALQKDNYSNLPSSDSPFHPKADEKPLAQKRSSISIPSANPTYTPSKTSPFSSEPLARSERDFKAISTSNDSPFSSADYQPKPLNRSPSKANIESQSTVSVVNSRDFKANTPSEQSPFSGTEKPPTPIRRTSLANVPSTDSPFNAKGEVKQSKASIAIQHSPGGNQSFNLFAEPVKQKVTQPTKVSATYGYASESPFAPADANNNSRPSTPARQAPKANNISNNSPFSNKPVATATATAATENTRPLKANEPAAESPFSKASLPPKSRQKSAVNILSATSPFHGTVAPEVEATASTNNKSIRVQQSPGGNQSFNIFG